MIKPCPCGKTPEKLRTEGDHAKPKWAIVSCPCGEWMIEYRNDYKPMHGPQSNKLAEQAWNAAPRIGDNNDS
jgi:hypothetical protein